MLSKAYFFSYSQISNCTFSEKKKKPNSLWTIYEAKNVHTLIPLLIQKISLTIVTQIVSFHLLAKSCIVRGLFIETGNNTY